MGEYQGDSVVLKKMSLVGVTATKRQKMLNSFKGELAIMSWIEESGLGAIDGLLRVLLSVACDLPKLSGVGEAELAEVLTATLKLKSKDGKPGGNKSVSKVFSSQSLKDKDGNPVNQNMPGKGQTQNGEPGTSGMQTNNLNGVESKQRVQM